MKTDLYTKVVLTVIAGCLTVLVMAQFDLIPDVTAANTLSTGMATDYALVPVNPDGTIDVNVTGMFETIDVRLVDINTTDELEVNIEEVDGRSITRSVPVSMQ
jgi:hypothetical protein